MSSVKLKCEKKDLLCFICHENKWSLFNVNVLDVRQQIASIFNVEIKIAKNYKLCSSCEFNLKILHLANVLSSPSSSSSASSNSSTTKLSTTTTTTTASTTTTTTQKTTTSKNSNNNCLCGLITDNNDIYDPNKAPPNTINNNRKEQTYFKELKKKFYKHLKMNCEIRRKMNIACKNASTSTSKTIHQKYDDEQKQQQQQPHRYCLFNEIKIPRHIYNDNKLFNCKVAVVNNRGNDLIRLCMKREWSPTLPPKRRKMIDDEQKDNGIIVNENNNNDIFNIISNKLDSNSNDISNKKNDNNINDIKQQNCINNNNVDNVDKITNECNEKSHPANETDTNTNKTTTKRVTFSDKIEYVPFHLNPSITADTLNRFAKFSIFKSLKKNPLSSENSTTIDEAAVNQPNENETLTKTNGLSSENSTEIDEAAVNQPNENATLTKTNGLSNELDLVVVAVSNQNEKQKTKQLNVEKKNVEKVDDDDEKENEVDKIEATSKNSLSTKNIRNIDGIVADTSKTNIIIDPCNVVEKDATQPQHKDLSKTSSNELSENKGNNGNGDGNINDDDEPSTNNIDNSNKKQQHNNDINFIDSYLIHLSSNIRLTTSLCKTTTKDATKLPPCNDNENCDNIQEIYSSSSSSPSTDNTKTSSIDNNIPKEINKNESHFPEQILSDS